jgi:putative membrane protein
MNKLAYLFFALLFLLSAESCHDRQGKNYNKEVQVQEVDPTTFIKDGIEGSMTEIKASGLAITNSNNQKVISLAKMLIEDHTKVDSALKELKADKKITDSVTISSAHMATINDISKKSGAVFDKAYLQLIVNDHEQAVKLYTSASNSSDSKIKKIASENLPAIKMHLDSANKICIALK